MTIIDVKKVSDDDVKKRLNEVIDLGDWSDEWENCGLPQLLHHSAYTRQTSLETNEALDTWSEFRVRMKPLVGWIKKSRNKEKQAGADLYGPAPSLAYGMRL